MLSIKEIKSVKHGKLSKHNIYENYLRKTGWFYAGQTDI